MKRLIAAVFLVFVPGIAMAFDGTRHPARIAVLLPADTQARADESPASDEVTRYLARELRQRGFDAFDADRTYDEAVRDGAGDADYAIEIIGEDSRSVDRGGVGVGGRHGEVSISVLTSRVAAELRVYDGQTMELIASEDLSRRSTALLPTSVGLGGRAFFAWVALPFVERAQMRGVARAAARDAASAVTAAVRQE
jgi:hypothetical protein